MLMNEFVYGGFYLIVWTGIFLGILHTLMPCEDKAIFCFYAFGVSRDWKQAFKILNLYGFGLFLMNIIIGTIISYFASGIGAFLRDQVSKFVWNGVAALSLIISGIVMLYQLYKNKYWPHTDQYQELTESIGTLRARKRTAFLLGLLAGIPPCVFELAVYIHAMSLSVSYGWGNGVWVVFFFGLGTWVGLFPLALLGSLSGRMSKMLKNSSLRRILRKRKIENSEKNINNKNEETEFNPNEDKQLNQNILNLKENPKKEQLEESNKSNNNLRSKFELFSGWALILLGLIFLLLAIFQVDIFGITTTPRVPAPFNWFG